MHYFLYAIQVLLLTLFFEIDAQNPINLIYKNYDNLDPYKVAEVYSQRYNSRLDSIVGIFQELGYDINDFEYFDFFKSEPTIIIGITFNRTKYLKPDYSFFRIDSTYLDLVYYTKSRFNAWACNINEINILTRKSLIRNNSRNVVKAFNTIKEKNPDILLINRELYFHTGGSLMYIKNKKIFIYLFEERESIELYQFFENSKLFQELGGNDYPVDFWGGS